MRSYLPLLLLAGFLALVAVVARTGWLRRASPGPPANRHVRAQQEAQSLGEEELRLIAAQYAGATVTPSGLRYLVVRPGIGEPPASGAEVSVHYTGRLLATGQQFDSSRERGQPFRFRVGAGRVIAGWDEALATMRPGEQRVLIIPWWLAYGARGKGPIPPHATLVFDVERLAGP